MRQRNGWSRRWPWHAVLLWLYHSRQKQPVFFLQIEVQRGDGGGSEESPERDRQAKHIILNSVELTWTAPIDCSVLCLVLHQRYWRHQWGIPEQQIWNDFFIFGMKLKIRVTFFSVHAFLLFFTFFFRYSPLFGYHPHSIFAKTKSNSCTAIPRGDFVRSPSRGRMELIGVIFL